jgi:hypothetical protein
MVDKNSRAYKWAFAASFGAMKIADTIGDTAVNAVSGTVDVLDSGASGLVDGVTAYYDLKEAAPAPATVTAS